MNQVERCNNVVRRRVRDGTRTGWYCAGGGGATSCVGAGREPRGSSAEAMSAQRPFARRSHDDFDTLVEEWTLDSAAARDRTVDLVRTAHVAIGPPVVISCMWLFPGNPLTIAAVIYMLSLVVVFFFVQRTSQVGWLAAFDVIVIGFASATDPVLWVVLLTPTLAATTGGWLVSHRVTWMLWALASAWTGLAGALTEAEQWPVVWATFVGTSMALHRNNVEIIDQGRVGVLRVTDLIDSLPVIVWESDPGTGRLTRALGWVDDMVGFSPAEWRTLTVERRIHRDDLRTYLDTTDAAIESDQPTVHEFRLNAADGSARVVREVLRRVDGPTGPRLRGVVLDISDEVAVRAAVDRLAAVIDRQVEPLLVIAPRTDHLDDPVVLQANPAFARMADADPADIEALPVGVVLPWLPKNLLSDLDEQARTNRDVERENLRIVTPTATRIYDYALVGLPDGSTAVEFKDVTERQEATETIRHQAFHDPLTGLPNRALLFDRLSHALTRIGRDETTLGLLLMDLDEFKEINDTLGHGYGDDLLTIIAHRLNQITRELDTVSRLGGDEFAMVIAGADEETLSHVAARIVEVVREPVNLGGIDVEVSVSIGGTVAPLHGRDPHALLQHADVAMYSAKRSGGGFRFYVPDDDRHTRDRLELMGELRNLLDAELELRFQPKVDISTGRSTELEALARWQHPERGLLGPDQFLELCEVSGLIGELTYHVIDLAIEAMVDLPGTRVAVNVPVRNLYQRKLPEQLAERLEAAGVAPDRLILEITEREVMEDHRAIFDVLEAIDQLGIRISIDDFGTGFSSLTHLRRLPIREIKIDRSFISGMVANENDRIIARSIIDLGHNLGHRVVAEGVEDRGTLDLLRDLGCDVAQGFLFGRPSSLEEVRDLLDLGFAISEDGSVRWLTPS